LRFDARSLGRSNSSIPACAAELLFFNALALSVVDSGSLFSALAKSLCPAIVVRAFASGWDWNAKPCCAPRPRLHLIRFQGVLAPNVGLRAAIVPGPAKSEPADEHAHGAPARPLALFQAA
jgi:hypothetical protein